MCQTVHQKWVPAKDQGAFLTMFDDFLYIKKIPNEVLPIFFCLEYYAELLETKITRSRSAPLNKGKSQEFLLQEMSLCCVYRPRRQYSVKY